MLFGWFCDGDVFVFVDFVWFGLGECVVFLV